MTTAIIIVDHGSRSGESNVLLHEVAAGFAGKYRSRYAIVEPAHMELAEPSIRAAYGRCVARGADQIIVCPFFLGPGKHWRTDIPRLAAEAAEPFPETTWTVAPPLGVDDLMLELLSKRAAEGLSSITPARSLPCRN